MRVVLQDGSRILPIGKTNLEYACEIDDVESFSGCVCKGGPKRERFGKKCRGLGLNIGLNSGFLHRAKLEKCAHKSEIEELVK